MDFIKPYPVNTVIVAQQQTAGRGRGNHKWISKSDNNLLTTFKIKLNKKLDYNLLVFISNIAMRETIEYFSHNKYISVVSKLHNDVLINGKKVCGILIDRYLDCVLVGIGVNIDDYPNVDNKIFPLTSLKENNINIDKMDLLKEFLKIFNQYVNIWEQNGFKSIKEEFLKKCCFKINEKIEFKGVKGTFKNLDNNGVLMFETEDGTIYNIKAGDIFNGK